MNLPILYCALSITLVFGAILLHAVSWLEHKQKEKTISEQLAHAPGLDVIVAFFTLFPNLTGLILGGWPGFGVAIAAQVTALVAWMIGHELVHYRLWKGPKISRTLGRLVGNWQNHVALWVTLPAISAFWAVRLYEITLYPVLTWTVRFPRYEAKDWVSVSRHKFDGLVGYDLIWCLYCDWMTGVWALGTEMLRNLESFWCPIRFYSDKKCENCKIDFPDIDQGWVPADSTMDTVTEQLMTSYAAADTSNAWYGYSPDPSPGQRNPPPLNPPKRDSKREIL